MLTDFRDREGRAIEVAKQLHCLIDGGPEILELLIGD